VIIPLAVPRPNRQCFVSKKKQNVLSLIPLLFFMSHIVSIYTMCGALGQGLNEERKMTRFKTEAVAFPQDTKHQDTGTNRRLHRQRPSLQLISHAGIHFWHFLIMDDITSHDQNVAQHPTLQYREQFTAAMVVAGRKVAKTDIKEETPTEMYFRINAAKVVKENKTIKSAAKKLVKKKKLKKISSFFIKK
jgi:hypothetical protein